mgnify:FL=1
MKWIGTSWKMNHDLDTTKKYINALKKNKYIFKKKINFFIIPPFTSLPLFLNDKKRLPIVYGAQNMHWEESGAFTGEVSAAMIKSCGCSLVELGHAERFKYFNEQPSLINRKIILALKYKLIPLICIGEKKIEKNFTIRKKLIKKQLDIFLKKILLKKKNQLILAYEPNWAIGKNKAANVGYCQDSIQFIKEYSQKKLDKTSQRVDVLYGGSINEKNVEEFTNNKFIDGVFMGRSCLKASNFIKICKRII